MWRLRRDTGDAPRQKHATPRFDEGPPERWMLPPEHLDGLPSLAREPLVDYKRGATSLEDQSLLNVNGHPHEAHREGDNDPIGFIESNAVIPGQQRRFTVEAERGATVDARLRSVREHLVPAASK